MLAWAATDLGLIDAVPYIRKLSVRDEPRTVTREHYEALLRETSGQMRTMLLLAGDAGLRIGEVVALEWRCVTARGLCVCATNWRGHVGTPKSGRTRLVPLTARLRGELDGLPRELATVVRFVPTSWVVRILDPICTRLRIARVTLHACRHSFASELARRGVALGTIRDLLGHSNVATTDRYLHTEPGSHCLGELLLDVEK